MQGCVLTGITETWWDDDSDWNVGVEGFRLCVNDQLECMELCLGMEGELTENLWVRIKGRVGTGDIIAGTFYSPSDLKTEQMRQMWTNRILMGKKSESCYQVI